MVALLTANVGVIVVQMVINVVVRMSVSEDIVALDNNNNNKIYLQQRPY